MGKVKIDRNPKCTAAWFLSKHPLQWWAQGMLESGSIDLRWATHWQQAQGQLLFKKIKFVLIVSFKSRPPNRKFQKAWGRAWGPKSQMKWHNSQAGMLCQSLQNSCVKCTSSLQKQFASKHLELSLHFVSQFGACWVIKCFLNPGWSMKGQEQPLFLKLFNLFDQ